ncbi:hypothetical protein AAE02nite_18810 [Adhaeribacter aerolatus]|uniref:Uncharacterized protein n=1 Tax=Adhaeribacter aerolatus TaxID=670289 RepID=A0A512AXH6_9BACT|nr:hypothetical protein [Adhaeribacter aerolatus]GEO04217.1 hypothetical protein AAE02nite_18810 [Adhaeribacter aerolatus]
MDKNKVKGERAKAPQNRMNIIRPDDGQKAGNMELNNSNEMGARAGSSGEMASGSAGTARIEDNNKDSQADISADNQTMGIP